MIVRGSYTADKHALSIQTFFLFAQSRSTDYLLHVSTTLGDVVTGSCVGGKMVSHILCNDKHLIEEHPATHFSKSCQIILIKRNEYDFVLRVSYRSYGFNQ